MKTHPYHTTTSEHSDVYHDREDCPYGQQIMHKHRQPGTEKRRRCSKCKDLARTPVGRNT